ncbi:MAG: YceI family protein [Gemmatimonadales bacterium]|jgi:polyisoprenoid-binding protein YceI
MTSNAELPVWAPDLVHSSIGFTVRHLVVSKVRGKFGRWTGSILMDEHDLANTQVDVSIETASVDTGVEQRDNHLRSADFFDVEKYPKMAFTSTRVEKGKDGELRLHGTLTLHGVTRPVVLDVEYAGTQKDPWGGMRAGFSARTSLDRKDFGLTWNQLLEAGGVAVGDKVEIDIEIEGVKQVPAPAAV